MKDAIKAAHQERELFADTNVFADIALAITSHSLKSFGLRIFDTSNLNYHIILEDIMLISPTAGKTVGGLLNLPDETGESSSFKATRVIFMGGAQYGISIGDFRNHGLFHECEIRGSLAAGIIFRNC